MSLRVWLPLTKDLRNQGLDDVTVTNNGATFNSAGKLGGCYSFSSNAIYGELPNTNEMASISGCCWVYLTNLNSAQYFFHLGGISSYPSKIALDYEGSIRSQVNGVEYNSGITLTINTWYHITVTVGGNRVKWYLNGEEKASTSISGTFNASNHLAIGARINSSAGNTFAYPITNGGRLNDVRIYDHCLSPMEVKELSKGLVLHYPLSDNSIQSLDNCYAYPRFETSNSNGGWFHWGSSGHVGTYGQTTDTNYIFRNGQTYAHWVADGSSATKNYLLYQEPAFDGGLRSLVAICKEENSKPITNDICYATWNARNGGVANDSWTSIQSLGNGFYLCKCEGISQDGSNDLVGIYIKPGYKVYFSEVYLENNRSISSDMFFPTNIVYDCSGFCNNGTILGTLNTNNDTAKYRVSTYFNGSSYIQTINNVGLSGDLNLTMSFWIKADSFTNDYAAVIWNGYSGTNLAIAICVPNGKISLDFWNNRYLTNNVVLTSNNWYHVCCTKSAGVVSSSNSHIYVNGQEVTGTANNYSTTAPNISGSYKWIIGRLNDTTSKYITGKISDVRIYATALSADDVKSLYQNSAYIDSSGNVYGAVHTEV